MGEADEQRGDSEIGTCHVCGSEFASQEDLSKHLMDIHQEDLLPQREDEAWRPTLPGSASALVDEGLDVGRDRMHPATVH